MTGYKGKLPKKGADSHATPKKRFHHTPVDTDQFLVPDQNVSKLKLNGDTMIGGNKRGAIWHQ
eukprot:gene6529-7561_t